MNLTSTTGGLSVSPSPRQHRSVASSSSLALSYRRLLQPLAPVAVAAAASRHAALAAFVSSSRQRAAVVAARASAVPPSSNSSSAEQPSSSTSSSSSSSPSSPSKDPTTTTATTLLSSSSSSAEPLLTPATAAGVSTAAAEAAARVLFDPEALAAASAAALAKSRSRVARLELLVDLRRLYRNLLRADRLLEAPAPAYCPPPPESSSGVASGKSGISDSDGAAGDTDSAAAEVAAAAAVQYVAELQLTEVQLRAALRSLSGTYGDSVSDAFMSPHLRMVATTEKKEAAAPTPAAEAPPSTSSSSSSDASETAAETAAPPPSPPPIPPPPPPPLSPEAARDALYARVAAVSEALGSRWRSELPLLPFPSPAAAQAALDTRNRRYVGSPLSGSSSKGEKTSSVLARGAASLASAAAAADSAQPAVVVARLSEAEKAVEQFFARRLQPAVAAAARAPPEDWLDGARSSAKYAKGLWDRLNGGGRRGGGNGRGMTGAAAAAAEASSAAAASAAAALLPASVLPLPPLASTRAARAVSRAALASDVAALEAALRGASAAREARVRAVFSGPQRARLLLGSAASELRSLDAAVAALTRNAALRSLQLEAEAAYGALEDEALDVAQGTQDAGFLLFRQGSSEELALLAAEFALLEGSLAAAAAAAGLADVREDEVAAAVLERLAGWKEERRGAEVGGGGESSSSSSSSSPSPSLSPSSASPHSRAFPATIAAAAAALVALPYDDSGLESLAREVPDLRRRLGIADDTVFALVAQAAAGEALLPSSPSANGNGVNGNGKQLSPAAMLSAAMSPQRIREVASESGEKVVEGALFFARGLKLLGTDVRASCGLFTRAAAGASLKPREVAALRRTARDVATFVPFAAILIAPLTPVGHVLVFGFLQRYFPGFFPSQFTSRRQELMMRYEDLRKELVAAQEASMQEAEAAELARAAAAVARLTAPKAALSSMEGRDGEGASAAAAAMATAAARKVVEATTTTTALPSAQAASSPSEASSNNNNKKKEAVAVESDESEDDTGPAAAALRSLETAVEAAAEEALSAGTDE